jgi:hypothetical protein
MRRIDCVMAELYQADSVQAGGRRAQKVNLPLFAFALRREQHKTQRPILAWAKMGRSRQNG